MRKQDVRACFANPGTTELALVRALDDVPDLRPILGLFEGVCTGAADGYARVSGVPALTLLHLGPGLANGLANLHNALRAYSPVINIVGDHATWHLKFDSPLTSDIESLARPMSRSVTRLRSQDSMIDAARAAVDLALEPPCGVVTLIAPSDLMEAPFRESRPALVRSPPKRSSRSVQRQQLEAVATQLAQQEPAVILLGGIDALSERGLHAAQRVAELSGARLMMESYPALVALGGNLPRLERLAYFPGDVREQLGEATVVLVGARAPVSYFGYPGEPSELVLSDRLVELSAPGEDGVLALEHLVRLLPKGTGAAAAREPPTAAPGARLSPVELVDTLISHIPEGAVVSVEGSTCGVPYLQRAYRARRHWAMTNTGGAIGQGIPCALGAAVAKPDSRIICLQSDGSAQYTVQALWTLAREQLKVTVIICANRRYGILQTELQRAGADVTRSAQDRLTRIDTPPLDWVALARGYGVPGSRVSTSADLEAELRKALATAGPYLIEAELP